MPKLSIIVPVYNVENYIEKCLDSLINQTLKDIEIICVDDCGTDNSIDIVKQYIQQDNRIHLVRHETNKGLGAARNTGLKYVTSDFVAFIDADDYLEVDAYEKATAHMTSDIDLVCFGIQTEGNKNPARQASDDSYYKIRYTGKTPITQDILYTTDVSSCNKIFKKSLIDKLNISYPEGLRYEDNFFFYTYCMQISNIFFMQEKFYHYVRRENSIMDQTFIHQKQVSIDHTTIGIKLYQYMKEHQLLDKWNDLFFNLFLSFINFSLSHEDDYQYRNKIYTLANTFLEKENLYSVVPHNLKRHYSILKNNMLQGEKKKFLGGIVQIKETIKQTSIKVLGIPVLRIRYKNDVKKYYLLHLLKVITLKDTI